MTGQRRDEVTALLGRVTLTALRRRSRERTAPVDTPGSPAEPRIIPSTGKSWLLRAIRHPVALVFLALGAMTTLSLVFAATRLSDDGNLSAADWFRLTIVAIIAVAFLARILSFMGRLPPVRRIRRALKRPVVPVPMAAIPSVESEAIGSLDSGFGRLTSVERSRIRTQTAMDDAFWVGVNVALAGFGGLALYGLGFSAMRDIVNGEAGPWAYLRLAMFATAAMGLSRLFRASIAQLRLRRQRRRKRVTRRLLRYLLWWDSPAPVAVASASRFGPTGVALAGLAPFLIFGGIAVSAAAYSPWGEPVVAEPADDSELSAAVVTQEPADTATSLAPATSVPTTTEALAPGATVAPTTLGPTTTVAPDATVTTTVLAGTTTTPAATTTAAAATTTAAPPTTTAAPTTTAVPTTTAAPTTTAVPTTTATPAPLMVINSLTQENTGCFSDMAEYKVTWSVSGDPDGQVDIWRWRSSGGFVNIGVDVGLSGFLFDTPPGMGNYEYWLIATNSDGVQPPIRKAPFTVGFCVS